MTVSAFLRNPQGQVIAQLRDDNFQICRLLLGLMFAAGIFRAGQPWAARSKTVNRLMKLSSAN